jgi:hypothetical protein
MNAAWMITFSVHHVAFDSPLPRFLFILMRTEFICGRATVVRTITSRLGLILIACFLLFAGSAQAQSLPGYQATS